MSVERVRGIGGDGDCLGGAACPKPKVWKGPDSRARIKVSFASMRFAPDAEYLGGCERRFDTEDCLDRFKRGSTLLYILSRL